MSDFSEQHWHLSWKIIARVTKFVKKRIFIPIYLPSSQRSFTVVQHTVEFVTLSTRPSPQPSNVILPQICLSHCPWFFKPILVFLGVRKIGYGSKNFLFYKWKDHLKHKLQFWANTPPASKREKLWTTKLIINRKLLHVYVLGESQLWHQEWRCACQQLSIWHVARWTGEQTLNTKPTKKIHTQFLLYGYPFSL